MKEFLHFLAWLGGPILILAGIGAMSDDNLLSGILFMICGLLCFKSFRQMLFAKAEKKPYPFSYPIIFLALFIFAIAGYESEEDRKHAKIEQEKKAVDCKKDIDCLYTENFVEASFACAKAIESLAKYDFKWTDGTLEVKFPRYGWGNQVGRTINFYGDYIQFQNGFGAYQNYNYFCEFDTVTKTVIEANANPLS